MPIISQYMVNAVSFEVFSILQVGRGYLSILAIFCFTLCDCSSDGYFYTGMLNFKPNKGYLLKSKVSKGK